MSLRRFALLTAIIVSGAAASASGQESDIIRGKVTGSDSLPLENVKVTVMSLSTNQSISKNTGKDGRFTIVFPNGGGDFMVSYSAIGFQPTQKEPVESKAADIGLGSSAVVQYTKEGEKSIATNVEFVPAKGE